MVLSAGILNPGPEARVTVGSEFPPDVDGKEDIKEAGRGDGGMDTRL